MDYELWIKEQGLGIRERTRDKDYGLDIRD